MKELDEYRRVRFQKSLSLVERLIEASLERDNDILSETEMLSMEFSQWMIPPVVLWAGRPELESIHIPSVERPR
jgi:hypothetical protein